MAGVYYMGGDDPDFYNIDQLFNSLATQGTSDTVIVNVRAGSYIPVDTDMNSFESDFPVIVQSEDFNRDSVTWNASNVQINFSFPGDLHFKHITFDAYDSNAGAVRFWNSESLRFDTCRFVAFPGNNNSEAIRITSTTEKVEFYGCEIIGGDSEIRGSPGIFKHNAVYSDVNFEGAWEDISENKFHFWAKLPSASEIFENRFYDDVSCSFCEDLHFHDNVVEGGVNFSFPEQLDIISNIFKDEVDFGHGEDLLIANNYFFQNVRTTIMESPSLRFVYNNFAFGAIYRFWGTNIERITNNNFYILEDLQNSYNPDFANVIQANNFWPDPGYFSTSSYNIDPMYYSDDSLRTTNPLLAGLGIPLWFWGDATDIEGNERSFQPSIGAHELCYDVDTVTINCGQPISPQLCTFINEPELVVSPDIGVEYTEQPYPVLWPTEDTQYYFHDTLNNVLDSLYVVVEPFNLDLNSLGIFCGQSAQLWVATHDTSEIDITWSSEEEVYLYADYYWYSVPDESTQYTVSVDHPQCGISTDSMYVFVNDAPHANATAEFDQETLTVQFTNLSMCYTSVSWDFMDGYGYSNELNPTYQYNTPGLHTYKIYAHNGTQTDSSIHLIEVIFPIGLEEVFGSGDITIYPNPASDWLRVDYDNFSQGLVYEIVSITGRVVQGGSFFQQEIPLSSIAPGVYVLTITDEGKSIIRQKFVKY